MFAYSGWNAASYVAEEIRDPAATCRARWRIGTGAVVLVYLGLNVLYLYAVPIGEIGTRERRRSRWWRPTGCSGPPPRSCSGALAVVVLLGSLSAMTTAGPRVYFAMARDGAFFPAAARIHPTFHTPWVAILAQAVWSSLLVLTNTKDQLAEYTGFAVLLFSAFAVSTLFVLRRRHPDEPRPFRAWGYPVAPAIFVVVSLAITVAAIAGRPGPLAVGRGHHRPGRAGLLHLQADHQAGLSSGLPPSPAGPGPASARQAGFGSSTRLRVAEALSGFARREDRRRSPEDQMETPRTGPAAERGVSDFAWTSSAHSVTSASAPSAAANSRNDAGEPRSRWSATNSTAPAPFSTGPMIHR